MKLSFSYPTQSPIYVIQCRDKKHVRGYPITYFRSTRYQQRQRLPEWDPLPQPSVYLFQQLMIQFITEARSLIVQHPVTMAALREI